MPYNYVVVDKLLKLAPREYCIGCNKLQVGNKFYEVAPDTHTVVQDRAKPTFCPPCLKRAMEAKKSLDDTIDGDGDSFFMEVRRV